MRIGIIGAGRIGTLLARRLSTVGHDVKVANSRSPDTVDASALASGARAVWAADAVVDVDVVILSTPLNRIPDVAPLLAQVPSKTVVIDTSNYYPQRDEKIDALEAGQVESLWVAERLGRPIVKAWNSIRSDSFADKATAAGTPGRIALPVAAERAADLQVGLALVEDTGFDAFDAGSLAESWRQQPGAPCCCTDLTREELPAALAAADVARLPKRRDLVLAVLRERFGDGKMSPPPDYFVRLTRMLFL
jgi:8-hydroxy-5-deazaflavin:NADPH oxidoreductase